MTDIGLGALQSADMSLWDGRVDATEPRAALRWHQVVEALDPRQVPAARGAEDRSFCLVGYRCDDGIARNLGRPGAAGGPISLRQRLGNLPVGFTEAVRLLDAGDVVSDDGPVERAQQTLAAVVEQILGAGLFPIVLGGGHDLTFGHWLGVRSVLPPETRLGVVSFDAHFDVRSAAAGAHSGSSFWQIAKECERRADDLHYLCLGVQRSANTLALFRTARDLGVWHVLARDVLDGPLEDVAAVIDRFLRDVDRVVVTLDMDVFSSAFAPGVSSPQPLGLDPETVLRLFKHLLASGKVKSFDVAEVSPRFDHDDNTAKVAAIFIYALVEALTPAHARLEP